MTKDIKTQNWGDSDIQLRVKGSFRELRFSEIHVKEDGDNGKPSLCFVSEPALPEKVSLIGPMKTAFERNMLTIATQISVEDLAIALDKLGYGLVKFSKKK